METINNKTLEKCYITGNIVTFNSQQRATNGQDAVEKVSPPHTCQNGYHQKDHK